MSCTITLLVNRGGKQEKIVLGTTENPITNFSDVKKLLSKLSQSELDDIISSLPSIDEIENINIADITENSVGVFTPSELLSTLPKDVQETLFKLKIDKKTLGSNIIIAGFGASDIRTQFINQHIFLNLNYMYDDDNKVMALFDAALYLNSPENYSENISNLLNPEIDSSVKTDIIKKVFKQNANSKDINLIKSIYDFAEMKRAGSELPREDLFNSSNSVAEFTNNFNLNVVNTKRESNYTPVETVRVESLKRGDLIKIEFNSLETYKNGVAKPKTKFEVFYDYHINSNGELVVKTYSPSSEKPTINNRLVKDKNVDARMFNPDKFTSFSSLEGLVVPITDELFYTEYSYVYNLIKHFGSKVNGKKISSLQGSTVILEDGTSVNITKVKNVTTNKKELSFKESENIGDFKNVMKIAGKIKSIPVNTKILVETKLKDGNLGYKEAIVIAKGTTIGSKSQTLVYITSNNDGKNVVERIKSKEVIHIIPDTSTVVLPTERESIRNILQQVYSSNDFSEFVSNKSQRLMELNYSIEKINETTNFSIGDIIYDFRTSLYYKVVESNNDSVVLSTIINDKIEYIELNTNLITNAALFTKVPINIPFAINYITKNRYKIDTIKNPEAIEGTNLYGIESIEISEILQKPNGFVYSLTTNEVPKDTNPLFDENDKVITQAYRELLAARYNKKVTSKDKLYMYKYTKTGGILHDQNNTRYFDISNRSLSSIAEFLVPGSYVTFEGNAKSFVVEKVIDDKVLLSAYHYTTVKQSTSNQQLEYVIGEKFLWNSSEQGPKAVAVFLPKWAESNIALLTEKLVKIETKESRVSMYSNQDSPEIITKLSQFLTEKYNVKINLVSNEEMSKFKGISSNAAAFVYNGEIFINLDKASVEEPLHELLHLVLMTLKFKDPDKYYMLINSIQNHPLFYDVAKLYEGSINTEKLEETFVKLLSQTFRKKVLKQGIFTNSAFNQAISESVDELLNLTISTESEDAFDLFGNSVGEIMTFFGSKLLGAENGLIDNKSTIHMLGILGTINNLITNGNLKEECK